MITSTKNPRIKSLLQLRKSRERKKARLVLAEGAREISRGLDGQWELSQLYYCSTLLSPPAQALLAKVSESLQEELSPECFEKVAMREASDGLLAVFHEKSQNLADSNEGLYFILDGIEKPGNVGAILRTADAVGCNGIFVVNAATDIFRHSVVRASLGTVFHVPIFAASSEDVAQILSQRHCQIFVANQSSGSKLYTQVRFGNHVALVMGSEDQGVSRFWKEHSAQEVEIPMQGIADSLNVSVAAAVLAYEAKRQSL